MAAGLRSRDRPPTRIGKPPRVCRRLGKVSPIGGHGLTWSGVKERPGTWPSDVTNEDEGRLLGTSHLPSVNNGYLVHLGGTREISNAAIGYCKTGNRLTGPGAKKGEGGSRQQDLGKFRWTSLSSG